ncbi:MAG: hypothetical protein IPL78_09255 [Chloroflexi bacterium]|nr:hypothetical protein [Chloroflexota bacterium]
MVAGMVSDAAARLNTPPPQINLLHKLNQAISGRRDIQTTLDLLQHEWPEHFPYCSAQLLVVDTVEWQLYPRFIIGPENSDLMSAPLR